MHYPRVWNFSEAKEFAFAINLDLSYRDKSCADFINSLEYMSFLRKKHILLILTILLWFSARSKFNKMKQVYTWTNAHVSVNFVIYTNVWWEFGSRVNFSVHSPIQTTTSLLPPLKHGQARLQQCNIHRGTLSLSNCIISVNSLKLNPFKTQRTSYCDWIHRFHVL